MTTPPVMADDIVSGAVKYLLAQPDAVASVGVFLIGGVQRPGIFQYRPWAPMEGSNSTCAVLSNDGGWAGANMHNTLRFPRLTLNIWADPIRASNNSVSFPGEVMRRAYAVYKVFDAHLHRVAGGDVYFGDVRVISSIRLVEPNIYMVPDGDGLVRLQATYAITEG